MSQSPTVAVHQHLADNVNPAGVEASTTSSWFTVRRWVGGSVGYLYHSDNTRFVGGCVGSVHSF